MKTITKTIVRPPAAPPPLGPYSHAVKWDQLLFCSGQLGLPASANAPEQKGDVRQQTRLALENIQAILAHENLKLSHVVKTTVFMVDLNQFSAMNEVYGEFFTADFPARSTVQVAALPKGALVEIEAIAHYPIP